MRKQLLTLCLAIGMAVPTLATVTESGQTITINGQTVDKTATELTFDGDNVILHFNDGTQLSADMASVIINFGTTTGIDNIQAFNLKGTVGGILNLTGITPGQTIQIYDISGKKILETKVSVESQNVDISSAKAGTYILRTGNNVVKFIKK